MADPKQVDLLRQGVEVWNQHAQSGDQIDLYRADLTEMNLRGANLSGGDFLGIESSACEPDRGGSTAGGPEWRGLVECVPEGGET